jgi:hypothetical protein
MWAVGDSLGPNFMMHQKLVLGERVGRSGKSGLLAAGIEHQ